jgi:hypothetical protein
MIVTGIEQDPKAALLKSQLLGSLLLFTQTFFRLNTGRDFALSSPIGREPHQITIARYLTDVFELKIGRGWITLPPGHGKSTFMTYFIPWAFAHYPDCKFLYVSYSHELAELHTANVKAIMEMPYYKNMFGVHIKSDSTAKGDFKTTKGGAVKALGSESSITGRDGGLPNLTRFSGGVFMDDMHKPEEASSDPIRNKVISNFKSTISNRARGNINPLIGIGQGLHEADLRAFLIGGGDGYEWNHLWLKAEDDAGNILAPEFCDRKKLDNMRKFDEYNYWAQMQGMPQNPGGSVFKKEWFVLLNDWPEMIATFITVDTAESTKNYADYSVFSFFGLYAIQYNNRPTGDYGLHWIDCFQKRIDPADLEGEFREFYSKCLEFPKPPSFSVIEKKSTGTTLLSVLLKMRGMDVRGIERTSASGGKTERFLSMQQYLSRQLISLPTYGKHTSMCIEHMGKITANNTHQHDDIADTLYDGLKIALMSKGLINQFTRGKDDAAVSKKIMSSYKRVQKLRKGL